MTGWLRGEALGRPVEDVLRLVDNASGAAIDDAVATVLQGDRTGSPMICAVDCTLLRRDGVEIGVENRVTIIDDQAGNALGIVMAFRDVSKARAA
jgi:PAS domain S-box-containing protein